MAPAQHYAFLFLLPFGTQFTLYPRRSGCKWVYSYSTETWESLVASGAWPKMSHAITDPGPLAQTLLLEDRAVCTPPWTFHSAGLWASTSKPSGITSQFSLLPSSELLPEIKTTGINTARWPLSFWGVPHRLTAQGITHKVAERWTSSGLRSCFVLAPNKMFIFSCSNIETCIVPLRS